jgi:hypothetical protein
LCMVHVEVLSGISLLKFLNHTSSFFVVSHSSLFLHGLHHESVREHSLEVVRVVLK